MSSPCADHLGDLEGSSTHQPHKDRHAGFKPQETDRCHWHCIDGKSGLRAFLVQCECAAHGIGWSTDKDGVHLVAALHDVVAKNLTTMPAGAILEPDLIPALKKTIWCGKAERECLSSACRTKTKAPPIHLRIGACYSSHGEDCASRHGSVCPGKPGPGPFYPGSPGPGLQGLTVCLAPAYHEPGG